MRRRLCIEPLENRRLLAVGPIKLVPLDSGFSSPVVATHAGDGSARLFVAEQGGLVHVIRDGQRESEPFLDIRAQLVSGGASGERGLLGLAFHPDYADIGSAGEGLFYAYYSAPSLTGDHDSVIAEFRVSATDPDAADPLYRRPILRFNQPFSNHNGGDLKFGPDDGMLYISSGDGGSGGDPLGHGQNGNTLLGTILRIDVDGDDFPSDSLRNYSIPPSNPFVNNPDVLDEIYALGLRNPFRMSFDNGADATATPDRLFVGDVGQNTFEEIDIVHGGGNYGWNVCEGDHVFNRANLACPPQFESPVAEYGRNEGISVIGGFVYRGTRFSALSGVYIFGDLNGTLMMLEQQIDGSFARSVATIDGNAASDIIAFGEDEAGELYLLTFNQILSITSHLDAVVDTGGEVVIEPDGGDIVVTADAVEVFREDAGLIDSLTVNLSSDNDQLSIANLSGILDVPVSIDFGNGTDILRLLGLDQQIDVTGGQASSFESLETADITGIGANELILDHPSILELSSSGVFRVIHDDDDVVRYGTGWNVQTPLLEGENLVHALQQQNAQVEIINRRPFQNPLAKHDVNRDGDIGALDALRIINALRTQSGPLSVPAELDDPFGYLDVNGDNVLGAIDALQVINELARRLESESESPPVLPPHLLLQIGATHRDALPDSDDLEHSDDLEIDALPRQRTLF